MNSWKELWIDACDELRVQYEEDGMSEEDALERASEEAGDLALDRACSRADFLRKQAKEG